MTLDPYLTSSAACMGVVTYHHVIYPMLMASQGQKKPANLVRIADDNLPTLAIIMPAFNEADHILSKLRSIAQADYPLSKIEVLVGCDGCTDNTAMLARWAGEKYEGLVVRVFEFECNRGKVRVLNDLLKMSRQEISVMTDVSAILIPSALHKIASHFADAQVGAVGGGYELPRQFGTGQRAYSLYQKAIKIGESRIAGLVGAHGALYAIRTDLFDPLPIDTVNDDFFVPVSIAAKGWRTVYDPDIRVVERDLTTDADDGRRRRRIGAGNLQQAVRLLPRIVRSGNIGLLFAFASGKALRTLMGPLICLCAILLLASAASGSIVSAGLIATGLLASVSRIGRYALNGHMQSMLGAFEYICGQHRQWKRVSSVPGGTR